VSRRSLVPKPMRVSVLAALALGAVLACGGNAESAAMGGGLQAPDSFDVQFETTGGDLVIRFHRGWSPLAVDRVFELVEDGFYDGARFYRVNDQYVQFGFSGRPELDHTWMGRRLPDEPVRASNVRGAVSFGRAGPQSRNFVLFMNLVDNDFLDTWAGDGVAGFPPVGRVEAGLDVAEGFEGRYADSIVGREDSILASGNAYLDRMFPGLDAVVRARVVRSW